MRSSSTIPYTQHYHSGPKGTDLLRACSGIEYRQGSTGAPVIEAIYHPEGRVFYTSATASRYEYSIRDHLGNTRLTFSDLNNNNKVDITTNTATNEVLQENHYYPFGLGTNGAWMNAPALDNLYQYNGKELNADWGLNMLDYGARMYMADLGRWDGVDALASDYAGWSPYNYVMGNPLRLLDPDGMRVDTVIVNSNGDRVGQTSSGEDGNISVVPNNIGRQLTKGDITTDQAIQNADFHTTESVLAEAENVIQRTEANGGDREEASVIEPNGAVHRGETGQPAADGIARTELPSVPGNDNISIHSHPINNTTDAQGNIEYSSALVPGPSDPATFTGFKQNVIVGRLGPPVISNSNGTTTVTPARLGAVFYDRGSVQQGTLSRATIRRILNP